MYAIYTADQIIVIAPTATQAVHEVEDNTDRSFSDLHRNEGLRVCETTPALAALIEEHGYPTHECGIRWDTHPVDGRLCTLEEADAIQTDRA